MEIADSEASPPSGVWPLRMRAVEQLHERAIGDSAGHVAQLHQAVQPQLANAREIFLTQRRTHDHRREHRHGWTQEAAQHRQRQQRRVGTNVGIELCADTGERLVHVNGRQRARALVESMSAVMAASPRGRQGRRQHRDGSTASPSRPESRRDARSTREGCSRAPSARWPET